MISTSYEAELAPAALAYAGVAEHEHGVALAEMKLADIKRDLETHKAERARAIELEDKDAALRHVDGIEAAPPKLQRVKRIASLSEKIPALTAAIPLQQTRVEERRQQLQATRLPFTAAIVQATISIQEPAAERIKATLAALKPDLIDIIAADLIRSEMIGDRFPISTDQRPPFAGSVVARKLLSSIPPRLLPAELTFDRLEASARSAAAAAVHHIKENAK